MAGQIIDRGKNKWLVRVYLGRDENGKRKYHNKTIHGRKKDAQSYLTKVLREKDMGFFTEPSQEFLKEYLKKWLKNAVKPRVRDVTLKSYEQLVRVHLIPLLGDTKLSNLNPSLIQSTYNDLGEKLSPRTVRYIHSILNNSLEQAVKWRMLYQNPAKYVDLPRQKKTEMRALSPVEAKKFLEEAIYSRWYPLFSLLLTTGVRPGEALGLKWDDIDFEKGKIQIRRSLTRDGNLEEPKTARSRRTIPLPKSVLQDLKEHKKNQAQEKLKSSEYYDRELVFASQKGGPVPYRNLIRLHFKPILKKAGLPETIRLYDLRHTCATLLLSAGENPKVVSERLGHASIILTLDTYSHILPDMQQGAANKLETMLFNS